MTIVKNKHNYSISNSIRDENKLYNDKFIEGLNIKEIEVFDFHKSIGNSVLKDNNPFETVWLKNIDRLCKMLPDSLNHKDYSVLDVGCGSGISSLYFLERYNFQGIRGFDFSTTLIELAMQNKNLYLQSTQQNTNLSFDISDARDFKIDINPHILFMFNPFEGEVLERFFSNNIKTLCETKSFLLYAND